ncbi:MAG: adenylosuccinate synthetase [Candidatus Kaiserbacteria bacterium]|nr:MAG: adenylosuccinate synthetase [Candidatus Kaiserbacteria bacterium]
MLAADVIVDLQYGDCGKGKVAHFLCKTKKYTHVLRYNGGANAGHTIFHNGKKFVTHQIPAGVFFGIKSVVGSGCVLDPEQFFAELKMLEEGGVDTKNKIFVATNTHIITDAHKAEDREVGGKIGTTGRGNGPAYREKYGRTGKRATEVEALKPYLLDLYQEWYGGKSVKVLAEGAQGFGLDIDWGDYPYVTSSHCTTAGALLNGLPPSSINHVWGVAKVYETYVGSKKFQPEGEIFNKIADIGEEYGATTGRRRQTNWMNMQTLERAIRLNGVTHIVFNKVDVLRTVGAWAVYDQDKKVEFKTEKAFKDFVSKRLKKLGILPKNVFFSESKDRI